MRRAYVREKARTATATKRDEEGKRERKRDPLHQLYTITDQSSIVFPDRRAHADGRRALTQVPEETKTGPGALFFFFFEVDQNDAAVEGKCLEGLRVGSK
jgi:hypothetical protein